MLNRGTVVLVPFPFTDLSASKVRPALIISRLSKGDDVVVAFISSKSVEKFYSTDVSVKTSYKSFSQTGLKVDSIIKLDKIATLDKKIILGELGKIDKALEIQINKKLKILFGI